MEDSIWPLNSAPEFENDHLMAVIRRGSPSSTCTRRVQILPVLSQSKTADIHGRNRRTGKLPRFYFLLSFVFDTVQIYEAGK